MAVDVIDRLEAIEVDNAERQACPLKLGSGQEQFKILR